MKFLSVLSAVSGLFLLCSNDSLVVNAQPVQIRSPHVVGRKLPSAIDCGYINGAPQTFPLYYGSNQVQVGTTTITITNGQLVVKYDLTTASGCKLDINDSIHVDIRSTVPTKNLVPGLFPCKARTNGTTSQSISCALSRFTFLCCGPLDVYTHAALVCPGGKKETAFSGVKGCTKLTQWCNVATLKTIPCPCPTCGTKVPNVCDAKDTCDIKITSAPSAKPSALPSRKPSAYPSRKPSSAPSDVPTQVPSSSPSVKPSALPSPKPSAYPSSEPSSAPSDVPSQVPSSSPSVKPSALPSPKPSAYPSSKPSSEPSDVPTQVPSSAPSVKPSALPSPKPSAYPSSKPSSEPSEVPTQVPSSSPSVKPSALPSPKPSAYPSSTPSSTPSSKPSSKPSNTPSNTPSSKPSSKPSKTPSKAPVLPVPRCTSIADCAANALPGTCATECDVSTGLCSFQTCSNSNDCCKYTPGNDSGGICANGCGDNNVCLDANQNVRCKSNSYLAICNSDIDFCLCLIRASCKKTRNDCATGISTCCGLFNDTASDIFALTCPAPP